MIVCPIKELGRYAPVIPGLEEALKVMNEITDYTDRVVPLPNGNRILVQQGTTKGPEGQLSEIHHDYLDVQCIIEGQDIVGWAPTDTLKQEWFDEEKDRGMCAGAPVNFVTIPAGYCYVLYPEDAHMPNLHLGEEPNTFTKLVLKLKLK